MHPVHYCLCVVHRRRCVYIISLRVQPCPSWHLELEFGPRLRRSIHQRVVRGSRRLASLGGHFSRAILQGGRISSVSALAVESAILCHPPKITHSIDGLHPFKPQRLHPCLLLPSRHLCLWCCAWNCTLSCVRTGVPAGFTASCCCCRSLARKALSYQPALHAVSVVSSRPPTGSRAADRARGAWTHVLSVAMVVFRLSLAEHVLCQAPFVNPRLGFGQAGAGVLLPGRSRANAFMDQRQRL